MQTLARYSSDQGLTWSEPIDLTKVARDYSDPTWQARVVGPGGAIQTKRGRLVAPVWKVKPYGVLTIFSDDHGQTWQRGALLPGKQGGDEDQLVELADGRLLLDIRQNSGPRRLLATSSDAGKTWSEPRPGEVATPVACAVERLTLQSAGDDRNRIIWTGPKGPGRKTLVARMSYDEGQTFSNERLIADEPAAYSDLTLLKDKSVGVLWERGNYRFVTFTRLSLEFLEPKGSCTEKGVRNRLAAGGPNYDRCHPCRICCGREGTAETTRVGQLPRLAWHYSATAICGTFQKGGRGRFPTVNRSQ